MLDIVTTIKELNISVSTMAAQITSITGTLATVSGGSGETPTFAGAVNFAASSGTLTFDKGNGNGANYTTYNSKITLPTGTAFFGPDGTIKGYIDANYGYIDMKAGFRVNGVNVLTSKDFNPANYAPLAGATFSGAVTAQSLNVVGSLQAGATVLASVTSTGALAAASASITGAVSANSLTLAQGLAAATATVSGALNVSGTTSLAATAMTDGVVIASGTGGLHLTVGDSSHTGYVEFTKPGGSSRAGYVGFASSAGVISLSAEINGGFFNFLTSNGAVDPKVNGNTIWHAGNFTPTTSDLSAYLLKGSAVLTGSFDAAGFAITNVASFTTLSGTGTASIFSDSNTNDLVVRTGPSSGYFSTVFGADGSLRLPGALSIISGGATLTGPIAITGTMAVTGATTITGNTTVVGDITAHQNSPVGTVRLGNNGTHSIGFDGTYYQLPAADLHVNGAKAWTSGDFQPSSFVSLYQTYYWSTTSQPILTLASSSGAIGVQTSANTGALTIMSQDGTSSTSAYMSFLNQTRTGINFGLDANNNLAVGGWSLGNNSYKIFHQGNLSPIQNVRLANAGDLAGSNFTGGGSANVVEPFAGAVVTGAGAQPNYWNLLWALRWRYLQVCDQNGNWTTVSYV